MPFLKEIETGYGPLAVWSLTDSLTDLENLCQLNDKDRQTYLTFKAEKRKKEFLASRILIQKLLGRDACINYNAHGKPYLDNKLHISISHSSDFVVVFVSKEKIGIDVERKDRNIDKIATRFLHSEEQKEIDQQKFSGIAKTIYWCAKEAIFKCTEDAGIQFNEDIRIDPFGLEEEGRFTAKLKNRHNYTLEYLNLQNNIVVYCVEIP